jgi:hypothetical protein
VELGLRSAAVLKSKSDTSLVLSVVHTPLQDFSGARP